MKTDHNSGSCGHIDRQEKAVDEICGRLYDVSFALDEQGHPLTAVALIDELDEIMYIADVDTHELIFLNRAARKLMNMTPEKYYGQKCYKVIQNLDEPCAFCTNNRLKYDEFYQWEFTNATLGRHFQLKDKLINWNGRRARIEFAVDITERERVSQKLRKRLEMEQVLVNCIRVLFNGENRRNSVEELLKGIGMFYEADRVYVLEIERDLGSECSEWCAQGVAALGSEKIMGVCEAGNEWRDALQVMEPRILDSLDLLREKHRQDYEVLKSRGVDSVYVMPFGDEKVVKGCVVTENPKKNLGDPDLLSSISYFISAEIRRNQIDNRLKFMNQHDRLTGLPDRNSYAEYLSHIRGKKVDYLGVIIADINGLKRLNRDFGHPYGDAVVCRVAEIMSRRFLPYQVFRLSGDEFVVLCDTMPQKEFLNAAASLKLLLDGVELGVSIGFLWSQGDDVLDVDEMVRQADERMVYEKREYYSSEDVVAKRRIPEHEKRLKAAVAAGNFIVMLQPKTELQTEKTAGAEALVRYMDKENGLIYPDKFIPMLERIRCVHFVDLFVFEAVCQVLTRWKAEGRALLPISVNFSRSTMIEPDIAERMEEIFNRYDLPRNLIEIEVTESFNDIELNTFAYIGTTIKQMGFGLALDDYGSHYNNASMMVTFPMDVLKIDRKIICELEADPKACIVVRHVIQMCKELGVHVVAEGVETSAQRKILQEMGCRYAQGYFYGKPMPVAEFEKNFLEMA